MLWKRGCVLGLQLCGLGLGGCGLVNITGYCLARPSLNNDLTVVFVPKRHNGGSMVNPGHENDGPTVTVYPRKNNSHALKCAPVVLHVSC